MKALIVVDMQNDFCPGGALPVKEGDRIVALINRLMPKFDLVVATQDWHPKNHISFASNHPGKGVGDYVYWEKVKQFLWPDHCVQGTKGAEFVAGMDTAKFDAVFQKGTDPGLDSYSGFFDNGRQKSTGLEDYLKAKGVDEVYVVGLATDYCVNYTARDAVFEGFKTFLIEDAARGVDFKPGDIAAAIAGMKEMNITVLQSQEILVNK